MHFSLESSAPRGMLRSRKFITFLQIIFVLAIITVTFVYNRIDGPNFSFGITTTGGMIFLVAFVLASLFFIRRQKSFSTFDVDDRGVVTEGVIYPWSNLKSYHWYGETQGERVGLINFTKLGYDPLNVQAFSATRIARIRLRSILPRYIGLEIEQNKVANLSSILEVHGIRHTSWIRRLLGIS